MEGVVLDMRDATVEFECYTDETGQRIVNLRLHNDKGAHALIRLANVNLFIFDDGEADEPSWREVPLPIEFPGLKSEAGRKAAAALGLSGVSVYEEGKRVG
jgi:hypothetical protein